MLTIAVTVIGLWIYKHYRVKVDGVNFTFVFSVLLKTTETDPIEQKFILKRNYRKFYHQL